MGKRGVKQIDVTGKIIEFCENIAKEEDISNGEIDVASLLMECERLTTPRNKKNTICSSYWR